MRCYTVEDCRVFRLKSYQSPGFVEYAFMCTKLLFLWYRIFLQSPADAILPSTLQPGTASAGEDPDSNSYFLKNGVLDARIVIKDGVLQPLYIVNLISGRRLPDPAYAFQVETSDGRKVSSNDFQVLGGNLSHLEAEPEASQLSLRHGGWSISLLLSGRSLQVRWSVELRDDSNSLKLAFHMWPQSSESNQKASVPELRELCLLSGALKGGAVAGTVEGLPIVSQDFFLGVEHPKSMNSLNNEVYTCCIKVNKALALQRWQSSLALGVVAPGQTRRSFLHYLERERAHPSRRMLHYNTWYDIGTGQQFTAAEAQARLQHISKEMRSRGVALDAFLLDDGWDDPDQGPWEPHAGFSVKDLMNLEETAKHLKTSLGVWFSPFGGYHEPRPFEVVRFAVSQNTQCAYVCIIVIPCSYYESLTGASNLKLHAVCQLCSYIVCDIPPLQHLIYPIH